MLKTHFSDEVYLWRQFMSEQKPVLWYLKYTFAFVKIYDCLTWYLVHKFCYRSEQKECAHCLVILG